MEDVKGENVKVVVERDGEEITFDITPVRIEDAYIIGVQVALTEEMGLKDRMYYAFWESCAFIGDMFHNIERLLTGKLGIDKLAGPIGISNAIAESSGMYDFIYLLAFISISLGLTNFLPIPALDGGRMVLIVIEGITRKPINEKVEEFSIGFGPKYGRKKVKKQSICFVQFLLVAFLKCMEKVAQKKEKDLLIVKLLGKDLLLLLQEQQ